MYWTSQQVMDNLIGHDACPEGISWAAGKDSVVMWTSNDAFAAPYLFWWAAKNVDQIGWKNAAQLAVVLEQCVSLSSQYVFDADRIQRYFRNAQDTNSDLLDFFYWMLRQISEENQSKYFKDILPIVYKLGPLNE